MKKEHVSKMLELLKTFEDCGKLDKDEHYMYLKWKNYALKLCWVQVRKLLKKIEKAGPQQPRQLEIETIKALLKRDREKLRLIMSAQPMCRGEFLHIRGRISALRDVLRIMKKKA